VIPLANHGNKEIEYDCLHSNQAVTPDAFVKGNLNYTVWGMAGIVEERWEGNWP
jgi:hypothetical protein